MNKNNHSHDIFYDINSLSLKTIKAILTEARKESYNWYVDVLKSTRREEIRMSFTEIMKKATRSSHYVFVHRRGFSNWTWYLEIGFRTMTSPDFFLWINVVQEKKDDFITKYNLKILE